MAVVSRIISATAKEVAEGLAGAGIQLGNR